MMMDRVEGNAHALYWFFFDNSRRKKHILYPLGKISRYASKFTKELFC